MKMYTSNGHQGRFCDLKDLNVENNDIPGGNLNNRVVFQKKAVLGDLSPDGRFPLILSGQ